MILLYAPDCMAYDHDVSILFSCQASVTEVDGDNMVITLSPTQCLQLNSNPIITMTIELY